MHFSMYVCMCYNVFQSWICIIVSGFQCNQHTPCIIAIGGLTLPHCPCTPDPHHCLLISTAFLFTSCRNIDHNSLSSQYCWLNENRRNPLFTTIKFSLANFVCLPFWFHDTDFVLFCTRYKFSPSPFELVCLCLYVIDFGLFIGYFLPAVHCIYDLSALNLYSNKKLNSWFAVWVPLPVHRRSPHRSSILAMSAASKCISCCFRLPRCRTFITMNATLIKLIFNSGILTYLAISLPGNFNSNQYKMLKIIKSELQHRGNK